MFGNTEENVANPLTTEYLKQGVILPTKVIIADPTGALVSYEGGYACLALIHKNGAGELDLAGEVLDAWVILQNADGSWAQQYYPTRLKDGKYIPFAMAGEPYQHLTVDSGAAMLSWAMSNYDAAVGGGSTHFKTPVQLAMRYLRECQSRHTAVYPESNLLCNQRWDYGLSTEKWDLSAFGADSAECLLAMLAALTAYGSNLLTSDGYSVRTMANDIYKSIATLLYMGDPDPASLDDTFFWTQYPKGSIPWLMPKNIVPQAISYVQALDAWAIHAWAKSAFLVGGTPDYSYLCDNVLNFACAMTQGKWGGFYYHPVSTIYGHGIAGDDIGIYDEFPAFTSLMVIAMKEVDSTLYAPRITRGIDFIRRASFAGGRVFNRVKIDGVIDLGEAGVTGDGMHFRTLNIAQGLLADA